MQERKAITGTTGTLRKARKRKGMALDFIWRKNADAVVNECRRKAGVKSEIMIAVLTWFTDRFLWSPGSVTEVIPSFGSFWPNVFLSPVLHLHFMGLVFFDSCLCLMP